jgi:hypothetical protein
MRDTAPPAVETEAEAEAEVEIGVAQELVWRENDISRAVGLSRGCRYCIRAANVLSLHEQMCKNSAHCGVRLCAELKQQRLQTP